VDIRIYGQVATCVMVNGHQRKLMDVDKKAQQVQVLGPTGSQWVPYADATFMGKPLQNTHIRLSKPSGNKKSNAKRSGSASTQLATA